MRGTFLLAVCLFALGVAGCADARPQPSPDARAHAARARCHRVASPGHSVERLVRRLEPGTVGCLRGGTYTEDVRIGRGGRPGARVTLRSYPGERATLRGRLYVAPGADYVTLLRLRLNGAGSSLPSPTVSGDHVSFIGNDVTNDRTGICLEIFHAAHTTIRANRIHDCGRLPATNHDHGIYVDAGDHTRIVRNLIYDNADRGIQLYPRAYDTKIVGNVIDGNGEGILFSGAGGAASSRNRVVGNVIANSRVRFNVESYWPEGNPIGVDNVVTRNCVFGGARGAAAGGVAHHHEGFSAFANVIANPRYRDRARRDFRLRRSSRCRSVLRR